MHAACMEADYMHVQKIRPIKQQSGKPREFSKVGQKQGFQSKQKIDFNLDFEKISHFYFSFYRPKSIKFFEYSNLIKDRV